MASIYKKRGKWSALIRRSFHKPIHKSFISKQDAQRWSRETERLIEMGELIDTSEANKTSLKQLLQRYETEVSSKKRTKQDPYLIKNICKHEFVDKMLSPIRFEDMTSIFMRFPLLFFGNKNIYYILL